MFTANVIASLALSSVGLAQGQDLPVLEPDWSVSISPRFGAAAVESGKYLFPFSHDILACIDLEAGKLKWEAAYPPRDRWYYWSGLSRGGSGLIVKATGNYVFWSRWPDPRVTVFSLSTGEQVEQFDFDTQRGDSFLEVEGHLLVCPIASTGPMLSCVRSASMT
jgi:hypothetical protein